MYLKWNEEKITKFEDRAIEDKYGKGFVFTRVGKGIIHQTRSLRIELKKFELSSENRRILKKTENLILSISPIPYSGYDWSIHKMGKEFYAKKFGEKIFSAQKIKELITDKEKSNFNKVLVYTHHPPPASQARALRAGLPPPCLAGRQGGGMIVDESKPLLLEPACRPACRTGRQGREGSASAGGGAVGVVLGYCICLETKNILHYCYPFYHLSPPLEARLPARLPDGQARQGGARGGNSNTGMGMMLKAILWAKENKKRYVYLGSAQRPADIYKLQFSGLEWFDGEKWNQNLGELKKLFFVIPSEA